MGSNNDKTVLLNVGGSKYEVARTTIERYPDTMLARLVSDTWQQEKEQEVEKEEIFIDADGLHFRFVLEYMRHKKIDLPMSISKESVIKDLKYFGFESVPPADINYNGATCEAVKYMIEHTKAHRKELNETRQGIETQYQTLKRLADFTEMARLCMMKYVDNPGTRITLPDDYRFRYFAKAGKSSLKNFSDTYKTEFDEKLALYNLCYVYHDYYTVHVALLG